MSEEGREDRSKGKKEGGRPGEKEKAGGKQGGGRREEGREGWS